MTETNPSKKSGVERIIENLILNILYNDKDFLRRYTRKICHYNFVDSIVKVYISIRRRRIGIGKALYIYKYWKTVYWNRKGTVQSRDSMR